VEEKCGFAGIYFWLNDRLGKTVYVEVVAKVGDRWVGILTVEGTLRHQSAEELAEGEWGPRATQHLELGLGEYAIGDYDEDEEGCHLDLTRFADLQAVEIDGTLAILLAEDVRIFIQASSV
jgi:hypothetical protein